MLLAALWLPGMWNRMPAGVGTDAGLTMSLEEMAESDISPQELAAYLDLSLTEDLELDEATDYSVETVSTEELLALEESDFDLVLDELEETNFF
ncbi:MAG: hypothetical protein H6505_00570 [Calditrichaeota bacterium]|nr:hypothetical protein [Calditrichota bacterium]